MKRLVAALLLVAILAHGAMETTVAPPFGASARIVTTAEAFTNAVVRGTHGDWVIVPPGPTLHIPTNSLTLLRAGVNIECYRDIVFGTKDDHVARPIFSETSFATTNTIIFHRSVVVSNHSSQLVAFTNGLSRIYFEASKAWRAGTSVTYAVFQQGGGTFHWNVDELQNDGYDGYWCSHTSGAVTNYGRAGVIATADTAIEFDGAVTGYSHIRAGLVKRTQSAHYKPNSSLLIQDFGGYSTLDIDEVDFGTNGTAIFSQTTGGLGGPAGQYRIGRLRAASYGGGTDETPISILGPAVFYNTEFLAPARGPAFDALLFAPDEPIFDNCRITLPSGYSGTYAAVASLEGSIRTVGELAISGTNKPIDFNLNVNGITSGLLTNVYAATNVVFNVGGHSDQFLEVTNAMLLIVTNNAYLSTGKKVQLTMVNNKATNMNVAISADGRRIFGDGLQINAGMVSITVTNGRAALLDYQRIGTNNLISVKQQQN